MEILALAFRRHGAALLTWCIVGSLAVHLLILKFLPDWNRVNDGPPLALTVELRESPPDTMPPKPLPMDARPVPRQRPKPVPVKPVPLREERAVEKPRTIVTAPPEAPVTPMTAVVPEQRQAPPPEPSRPPPAPVAAPAPVIQPRFDAAYLRNPAPDYPFAAKRRGESGTVLLRVLVMPDGNPASVTIFKTSGSATLDDAASRAVRGWKFIPGREGDKPIQAEVHVPIKFTIKDD